MTQEYAIWTPERFGHAPPNWREGMDWRYAEIGRDHDNDPRWIVGITYLVPAEALNSPNDDAQLGVSSQVEMAIELVTRQPPEVLARYGITLAPEKDWATELWADLLDAIELYVAADEVREGIISGKDRAAIDLLISRMPKDSTDA